MNEQDFKLRLLGIRLSNFQDENDEKNQQAKIDELFKRKLEKAKEQSSTASTSSNSELNNSTESIFYDDQVDLNAAESNDQQDNQSNNTNEESYLCPVCSVRRYNQLDQLNEHVDYCLSRETIMSSVREFNDNHLAISRPTEQELSAKKRKPASPENDDKPKKSKITEYFNKA